MKSRSMMTVGLATLALVAGAVAPAAASEATSSATHGSGVAAVHANDASPKAGGGWTTQEKPR